MIPYHYHFEICEGPYIPEWLRSDVFLALSWVQSFTGLNRILEKQIAPAIVFQAQTHDQKEKFTVIEMGSGNGDSLITLSKSLRNNINFLATDKYPQPTLWKNKFSEEKNIEFKSEEISFENFDFELSDELSRPSLLFFNCAFHHMDPEKAESFLNRAFQKKAPILIVEPLQRNLSAVFFGFMAGVLTLFSIFGKNISLKQRTRLFLFTWVIPIIPFINGHDGIVSALRQRRKGEWKNLIKDTNYTVEIKHGLGRFRNFQTISFK